MPSKKRHIRHDPIVSRFAARHKERRLAAGLTQSDLAAAAALTPTYVTRLEAAGAAPGIDTVARLAVALATTVHDLLPDSAPPDPGAFLRDRGEALAHQLFRKADKELLQALVPLLSRLAEAPAKGK